MTRTFCRALAAVTAAATATLLQPPAPVAVSAAPASPGSGELAAGVKPDVTGLLDRANAPATTYGAVVHGWVVNVPWAALQAGPNAPIAANNQIDQALTQVRQLNATLPRGAVPMGLKIRPLAGVDSPAWAKQLGGAPVSVRDPVTHASGTVPRFWTGPFGVAYDAFQARLAAMYDSVPEIRDIDMTRCTTIYAEPMLRDAKDRTSLRNLLAAGYTYQADEQCDIAMVATAGRVWRSTHSSLALNPYELISANGSFVSDLKWPAALMKICRQQLSQRCTLGNNSIRASYSMQLPFFVTLRQQGAPLYFQVSTITRSGADTLAVLRMCASEGAHSAELPTDYDAVLSPGQLAPSDAALMRNPG